MREERTRQRKNEIEKIGEKDRTREKRYEREKVNKRERKYILKNE